MWECRTRLARPSAAYLKFLHRLRQTHFRNFKSKSGTGIIDLLVPLLLPKFVSNGAAMYHELRKRGTSAFFGRRKGHRLRPRQAQLLDTLLPRLGVDLTAPAPADL